MKLALISDIHGNYPALKAALEQLDNLSIDAWLCLGDLVGYGPFPEECVTEIRKRNIPTLMGNHDAGVVGRMPLEAFKEPNRSVLEASQSMLSEENLSFLKQMPLMLTSDEFSQASGEQISFAYPWLATHASPVEPGKWEYLDSAIRCREVLQEFPAYDFIFVGHTHRPALVPDKLGTFGMKKGNRYLMNPGSIGQPRDEDKRSSIMVLDMENYRYENIRIDYNVEDTIEGYKAMGISKRHARRLLNLKKKSSFWWF